MLIAIIPEDPELVVPVEKWIDPLTPAVPALAEPMLIAPLVEEMPVPDRIETNPPVAAELLPPATTTSPPSLLELAPTDKMMDPAVPDAAEPVET